MASSEIDEIDELDPADQVDEIELAFVRGDDGALKMAYDAHGTLVYSFCRRTLPEDRALDVAQEVFVSAWKARSTFDPAKGRLRSWLIGISKNRIIDNVRAERRHDDRRNDADVTQIPTASDIEHIGDRMIIADVLDELPDRVRTVIKMAYFEDLTHQEIAERTQIPIGTVKSDIRRGLTRMRNHLGIDLGFDLEVRDE